MAALVLCPGLGACGADGPQDHGSLPLGVPVTLSDTPVRVVGERPNDPDHELYGVLTPFLLPNGALGIPLSHDGTIRIFNAEGDFVRSLGSSGEGPGEFMGLTAAWARGDAIEALDDELNRVTRFVPGEPPATISLDGVASAQSGVPGLSDGSWILFGVKDVQRNGRDRVAVHRFRADGSHASELTETTGFRRHVFPMGGGPDPISPRPIVRTHGNRVYVAETLTPRINVFDISTGARDSTDWVPKSILSSQEAIRIARDALVGSGLSEGALAWNLSSLDALSGSEEVPVFQDFLVDGEDLLWVRDYDPGVHSATLGALTRPGPGGRWSVIDRDGQSVSTIEVPDDFEPMSIDSDYLIGVRRDELDVESLRIYRIERRER